MRKAPRLALFGSSLLLLGILLPISATPAFAASTKVVIVVGPTGSLTSSLVTDANTAAGVARKYTSNVVTIYTPHATWSAVRSAMQGANVVIYMGHGNGFPSPYSSTLNPKSVDGMGLNAYDGSGNTTPTYYGEYYIGGEVRLAPNAVVLLNHLCYASGNNEWGTGIPSLSTAKQRVVNFGAGFIRAGAKAVVADAVGDISWYVGQLFTRHSTVDSMFKAAPNRHGNYTTFASTRSSGYTAVMDVGTYSYVPDHDPYMRSMVSIPSTSTDSVVGSSPSASSVAPFSGKTTYSGVYLRKGPATSYASVTSLAQGTSFTVTGAIVLDGGGRTWAPIRLGSGATGWIASSFASFSGSARTTATLNLRSAASTTATVVVVIPSGTRFAVTGSTADGSNRTWLAAKLSSGKTGWVASWYTAP